MERYWHPGNQAYYTLEEVIAVVEGSGLGFDEYLEREGMTLAPPIKSATTYRQIDPTSGISRFIREGGLGSSAQEGIDDVNKAQLSRFVYGSDARQDFVNAANTASFRGTFYQEKDVVKYLTNIYGNQGIEFEETEAGFDTVRVILPNRKSADFNLAWGDQDNARAWDDMLAFMESRKRGLEGFGEEEKDAVRNLFAKNSNKWHAETYIKDGLKEILGTAKNEFEISEHSGGRHAITIMNENGIKRHFYFKSRARGNVQYYTSQNDAVKVYSSIGDAAEEVIQFLEENEPKSAEQLEDEKNLEAKLMQDYLTPEKIRELFHKNNLRELEAYEGEGEGVDEVSSLIRSDLGMASFWNWASDRTAYSSLENFQIDQVIERVYNKALQQEKDKTRENLEVEFLEWLDENPQADYTTKEEFLTKRMNTVVSSFNNGTLKGRDEHTIARANMMIRHGALSEAEIQEQKEIIQMAVKNIKGRGEKYEAYIDFSTGHVVGEDDVALVGSAATERITSEVDAMISELQYTPLDKLENRWNSNAIALARLNQVLDMVFKDVEFSAGETAGTRDMTLREIVHAKEVVGRSGINFMIGYNQVFDFDEEQYKKLRELSPAIIGDYNLHENGYNVAEEIWDELWRSGKNTEYLTGVLQPMLREYEKDLRIEQEALNRMYLLNENVTSVEKEHWENALHIGLGSLVSIFNTTADGEKWMNDKFGYSEANIVDEMSKQYGLTGIPMTEEMNKYVEGGFGEQVYEGVTGSLGILVEFAVANKATAALRTAKLFAGGTKSFNTILSSAKAGRYTNGAQTVSGAAIKTRADKLGISVSKYADDFGFTTKVGPNLVTKGSAVLIESLIEGAKFAALPSSAGARFDSFTTGFGFGLAGQVLTPLMPAIANSPRLNKMMNLGFKQPLSFAVGTEVGELMNAYATELMGEKSFSTFMEEHFGDQSDFGNRFMVNMVIGSTFGLTHKGSYTGWATLSQMKTFKAELNHQLFEKVDGQMKIRKNKIKYNKKTKKWEETGEELTLDNIQKLSEMYRAADYKLAQATQQKDLLDPILGPGILRRSYEKQIEYYKKEGYTLEYEASNSKEMGLKRAEFKEILDANGKPTKRMNVKFNIDEISLGVAPHELGHSGMQTLFGKDARFKSEFLINLGEIAKKIKIERLNTEEGSPNYGKRMTLEEALKEKDGKWDVFNNSWENARIKDWEMFSYVAEELAKPENLQALRGSKAFSQLRNLLNGNLGKKLNQKYDFTRERDIVDFFAEYINSVEKGTNSLKVLKHLESVIESGEGSKTEATEILRREWELTLGETIGIESPALSSRNLLMERTNIQSRKVRLVERNKELGVTKPEGWRKEMDANVAEIKSINREMESIGKLIEADRINTENIERYKELDVEVKKEDVNEAIKIRHSQLFETLKKNNQGYLWEFINQKFAKDIPGSPLKGEKGKQKFADYVNDIELLKIINTFNPKKGVPFGAYLKQTLSHRMGNILRALGVDMDIAAKTVSLDVLREGGFDIPSKGEGEGPLVTEAKNGKKGIELIYELPVKQDVIDKITKAVKTREGIFKDIIELDYLTLADQAPIETKTMFGKQGTSKTAVQERSNFIANNWKVLYDLLPHRNLSYTKGTQVGLENSLMTSNTTGKDVFYKGTGESIKFKKTGAKTGTEIQEKIKMNKDKFLAEFGIKDNRTEYEKQNETGDVEVKADRNIIGSLHNALMNQTGKAITNQVVRDAIENIKGNGDLSMNYNVMNLLNNIASGKGKELYSDADITGTSNFKKEIVDRLKEGKTGLDEALVVKHFGKKGKLTEDLLKLIHEAKGLKLVEKIEEIAKREAEESGMTVKEIDGQLKSSATGIAKISRRLKIEKRKIDGKEVDPTSLAEVNKNATLIRQRRKFETKLLNEFPELSLLPKKVISVIKTQFGFSSRGKQEFGKRANKNGADWVETLQNYYGKNSIKGNGKKYDGKYDMAHIVTNWGKLKKDIEIKRKDFSKLKGQKLNDAIVNFVRGKLSFGGKPENFEATTKANRALAKDFYMALAKITKAEGKTGFENLLVHLGMQTHHSSGISKAMVYDVRSVSKKGSEPGTYTFEGKEYKTEHRDHWEHELQLLNNTEFFVDMVNRHKNVGKKSSFETELDLLFDKAKISLIEKSLQLKNDATGPTTYGKWYGKEGKANLFDNPLLNVLTRKSDAQNQLILSGEFKGKTVYDVITNQAVTNAVKKYINSVPKKNWNAAAYKINDKIKNEKRDNLREIQNKDIFNRVLNSEKLGPDFDIVTGLKTVDEALAKGREIAKEKRGISVWDFDDTIAFTKSGVRYTVPNPTGKPAPGKKVIFMAGGAGSGKSNVIKQLGLEKQGFKIVNQDISLEWLMKNHGLPKDMREFTKEQKSTWGKLTWEAAEIAKNKQMKFQGKGDGVIVDGTGSNLRSMQNQVYEFRQKGYDVQMMFVETSKDISIARNKARKERSLKTSIVEKTWENVHKNKKAYKKMFGDRFAEVNTDKLKQGDKMPSELIKKLDAFTKGYIKGRLNAGEFANRGQELKEQGAEFDFAEFDFVKEGTKGPFFQKALDRIKKFGPEHQYILTARPPASQRAIHLWMERMGLEIPIENITALGNSTAEAKAMWMLKRASEGYNDFYFADDAIQNVRAVKDVLSQVGVKSKVVQARIKNVNRLDTDGLYSEVLSSRKGRLEYEKTISKNRPDLVKANLVSKSVDEMFTFIDGLNVPVNKKKKYQRITTKWLATSNIKIKEDAYKIKDAVELAEKYKEDIFSYTNPNIIIEKYAGKVKEKPTNPNTVKEFVKGTVTNKKHGITEHVVENTKEGQLAVRKVMDTHFGEKSNPWCIAQKKDGKLTKESWDRWEHYSDGPKSLVFQNGKLIGFKANGQYWDRMDNATDAPVVRIKDGRITRTVELVPIGGGKVQEFVMETRTTSKDKKTVTTEYHVERSLDQEGYYFHPAGTRVVENKINGITVKETVYKPNGKTRRITEFKSGKETESRSFQPDGKTTQSINRLNRDLRKSKPGEFGDFISHEITDGKVDYWHGEVSLESQGLKSSSLKSYIAKSLEGSPITEIGFKTPSGFEIMDIMKRVNGKLRVDLKKLREIDPDVKGLPKEVLKPEGMRALEPVKNVLDQLDIKSDIQQARKLNSDKLDFDFNTIIEEVAGVEAYKTYSSAKAKVIGDKGGIKGKRKWSIVVPGAQDFMGLMQAFMGKGKQGDAHRKFFEDNLIKPFSRGVDNMNTSKQTLSNDYKALLKAFPEVRKELNMKLEEIEGPAGFTLEQAIRVHRWTEAGFEIPGLSKTDIKELNDVVNSFPEYQVFSNELSRVMKLKEGYTKPGEHWIAEHILSDLENLAGVEGRKQELAEWKQNKDIIFSKDNLNKIEAIQGTKFREALEDILYRMETGSNRPVGKNKLANAHMNFINGYVGARMFFNVRSATLQLLSTTNYINWAENNPIQAAKAFANQPQFWRDFSKIFNSDMLRERRAGLKYNVQEAEIAEAVKHSKNKSKAAIAWLLKKGFTPTQIADSFAISAGGASYYRNKIKKYKKDGLDDVKAEKKAWFDFMTKTETTQQSSRPDLISQQQASTLGRTILAWANTPMQYMRIQEKAARDLVNGRGSRKANVSKIAYYGAIQSTIFAAMQSALFGMVADDEGDLTPKDQKDKIWRSVNTVMDSNLRGMGTPGSLVAAIKNTVFQFHNQEKKDYNKDHTRTILELASYSPPIGGKLKQLYSASKTWDYNEDVIKKMGLDLDNPGNLMVANIIEATTNIPIARVVQKVDNLREAADVRNQNWQRIAMLMGWSKWDVGAETEEVSEMKIEIKKKKQYPGKSDKEIRIIESQKDIKKLNKDQQEYILRQNGYNYNDLKNFKNEQERIKKIQELQEIDEEKINDLIYNFPQEDMNKSKKDREKIIQEYRKYEGLRRL